MPDIGPVGEIATLNHQLQVDQGKLRADQKALKEHQDAAARTIAADQARVQADSLAIAAAPQGVQAAQLAQRQVEAVPEAGPSPSARREDSGAGVRPAPAAGTDMYL